MRFLHRIANAAFCTFTALSLVFGVLCKVGVLVDLAYTDVVFTLLWMSIGTSVWVTLREVFLPGGQWFRYGTDIIGCAGIILVSLRAANWLELRLSYLLLIFVMLLAVYLLVWLFTLLQSKHDEETLNTLLQQQQERKNG